MKLLSAQRLITVILTAMLLASLLNNVPAVAQLVPAGSEFQVNTYTTASQASSSVAMSSSGDFVVVWESQGDGQGYGVFGQRYSSDGTAQGGEFQVNTYTTSNQRIPSVAAAANGDFVVVWLSLTQDGSNWGVFGQRFASDGSTQGGEFPVNTYTTGLQFIPSLAAASNGDFVVAWGSYGQDGSPASPFGQRFASDGTARGSEFQINTYTTGTQLFPSVAAAANGDFVAVWQSSALPIGPDGDDSGVFGQRYASDGTARGTEFQVNTYTTSFQEGAVVGVAADGDFVVVWASSDQDGHANGVFGQRYASDGTPRGSEFQVNTYTTSSQAPASIASVEDGGFVVIWRSEGGQDGDGRGVFGRRFASDGTALTGEFLVNTYTTNDQFPSAVAASDSSLVITWVSDSGQDGDSDGVFAQRYAVPPPDADADGVADSTENSGPNGGDGNDDGMQDAQQQNVSTLALPNGGFITMVTSGGCAQNNGVLVFGEEQVGADPNFFYPVGLVGFELPCASADIELLFHGVADLSGATYRKFGPVAPVFGPPEFYTLPGVVFGTTTVAGETVATASFSLTDGQLGDDTPFGDGIVDEGGPAFSTLAPAPALSGRMILIGVMALVGTAAFGLWRRRRTAS